MKYRLWYWHISGIRSTSSMHAANQQNSNPHAVSKNANHADYMYATGFEALLGYLFLNNEEPRMEYLIYKSFDICDGVIKKAPPAEAEEEKE